MSARVLARRPERYDERPLALGTVIAMREGHKARLHEAVIRALMREKMLRGLTEEALAVRLGKTPEEIDRFLTSPDGWTFEAMIDILTAAGLQIDSVRIGSFP
jgi:hypothetical protein